MLSNALQSLFGTVSNVYLGQMIGVDALAAVSAFFPVMFFLFAFVMGLSTGATVLIGQAFGAGEHGRIRIVVGTTLAIGLLLSLSVALVGGFFSRQLMTALATPADILDQASAYARIMLLTMPLGFVFLLMTAMIRGVGDAVTPLLALALSTTIGLILTPMLIRGAFGLPAAGITSPAWAAAIANALTLIALAVYLLRTKHALAPDAALLRHLRLNGAVLGKILGIGLPSAIGMVVMAIAELVLLGLVNGFGSDATAAYGAVNQVMGYTQFTAMSISIAVSILGAQAIGGGDRALLDGIVRTGLAVQPRPDRRAGGADLSGAAAPCSASSSPTAPCSTSPRDCFTSPCGARCRSAWPTVFSGAMRAAGVALTPMLLSIFAIVAIELPAAVILSRTIGLEGVWAAYPIVFCAMFVLQMGYYLAGVAQARDPASDLTGSSRYYDHH